MDEKGPSTTSSQSGRSLHASYSNSHGPVLLPWSRCSSHSQVVSLVIRGATQCYGGAGYNSLVLLVQLRLFGVQVQHMIQDSLSPACSSNCAWGGFKWICRCLDRQLKAKDPYKIVLCESGLPYTRKEEQHPYRLSKSRKRLHYCTFIALLWR